MSSDGDPKVPRPASQHSDLRDLKPAASARRVREQLPELVANQLLDLALSWRTDAGERVLARAAAEGLSELVTGLSVGVCVPSETDGQIVEFSGQAPPDGADPTRLFPNLPEERVYSVDDDGIGATVHFAGAVLPAPGSAEDATARRGVELFGAFLRQCRSFERARRASTDLRRLQAQVIQAEKLASLGQIAAGIVHELNNPLTSIIAYTDFLRRRPSRDDADEEERLRRIGEAAERILSFTRDLMSYARPAAEIPAPVPLADVLHKAIAFCDHEFAECGIAVSVDIEDPAPLVRGISGQLTQVFVNLFTNAAHAMPNGGELRVSSRHCDGGELLLVEVADNGIGIAEEDVEHVLEPFYTTKAHGRGTGLGLSIVHSIIKNHGGTLELESSPGRGTTFTLSLQLAVRPSTRPPPSR